MSDHDEELRMAFQMSKQEEGKVKVNEKIKTPELKRSKPWEGGVGGGGDLDFEESVEERNRRVKRELLAAAAEKRMMLCSATVKKSIEIVGTVETVKRVDADKCVETRSDMEVEKERKGVDLGEEISEEKANQLFSMIFGASVSSGILAQWTNQGIRLSIDQETSMGLVQHEGGPCGVLAAIQAFVLKHLIFFPAQLTKDAESKKLFVAGIQQDENLASNYFSSFTENEKNR